MRIKLIEEKFFKILMYIATLTVFAFVISILWTILDKGWGGDELGHDYQTSRRRILYR